MFPLWFSTTPRSFIKFLRFKGTFIIEKRVLHFIQQTHTYKGNKNYFTVQISLYFCSYIFIGLVTKLLKKRPLDYHLNVYFGKEHLLDKRCLLERGVDHKILMLWWAFIRCEAFVMTGRVIDHSRYLSSFPQATHYVDIANTQLPPPNNNSTESL